VLSVGKVSAAVDVRAVALLRHGLRRIARAHAEIVVVASERAYFAVALTWLEYPLVPAAFVAVTT